VSQGEEEATINEACTTPLPLTPAQRITLDIVYLAVIDGIDVDAIELLSQQLKLQGQDRWLFLRMLVEL
jgi:hypothetical protein